MLIARIVGLSCVGAAFWSCVGFAFPIAFKLGRADQTTLLSLACAGMVVGAIAGATREIVGVLRKGPPI